MLALALVKLGEVNLVGGAMPDGAVRDGGARVSAAVQDRDARVNALMQEALASKSIKKYSDDNDFKRQVDSAAYSIAEQYQDKFNDEKIIEGVIKAAYAIRKKVRVFVS